jgi:hypothetical protein
VVEVGRANVFRSRVRMYISNNERLYFEIISDDYQIISVSVDVSEWEVSECHFIVGNVNTVRKVIEIYCDGKLKSSIKYRFMRMSPNFLLEKDIVIGISLERQFPTPFLVQNFSCGDYLSPTMIFEVYNVYKKYLEQIKSLYPPN